jgi:hypothetical protein
MHGRLSGAAAATVRLVAQSSEKADSETSALGVQQREQQTRADRPSRSDVQYGPWLVYVASEGTREAMLVVW